MKHIPSFLLALLGCTSLVAQVTIDQAFTIEEYVNDVLLGDGVSASNITFIGETVQLAKMTDESGNFSVSEGLVLSCGDPNRLSDCQADANPTGLSYDFTDSDLLEVANSVPPLIGQNFTVSDVNDGCVLEFDFEAGGDSISFNYVFGSDEYLSYVNTQWNDIFAFFLSGPGITGPYAAPAAYPDGAINIAQVPDSDPVLPITISSVNDQTNSQYYIDNPNEDDICINGYTTTFTASAAVQCGETYHIKLAIADGSDDYLESIVVLEAGSFTSSGLNLNASAVPLAASGLESVVQYDDAVGLPEVFTYPNGESFPYANWALNPNESVEVDGELMQIDAVVIEGCNDAQFTVKRPDVEADLLDTLFLGLGGSAFLGSDFDEAFNQVVMNPGQTESDVTLGVSDDGLQEGVEYVEIFFEYVNGCGELVVTSSRVAILDPLPVSAQTTSPGCLNADGTQALGYASIAGYGPFNFQWGGTDLPYNPLDTASWASGLSLDSLFDMTDGNGNLIPTQNVVLRVQDQCQDLHEFTQVIQHPVISPTEMCGGASQSFPMFNANIPIQDLLYDGQSLLTGDAIGSQIVVEATQEGDYWMLNAISGKLVDERWSGNLVLVDTCGYETDATITVRDCLIPNVFTPDGKGSGGNNTFRIQGLEGFEWSRLTIFNRYGIAVFEDETDGVGDFELVWSGNFKNGDPAPEGVYQWVLVRSDGFKDVGQLTMFRQY
jgi:hypothetical protein